MGIQQIILPQGYTGATPILDTLGGTSASWAYSHRYLISSWIGHPLAHIRKPTDTTGIDIYALNDGGLDWVKALDYAAGGDATLTFYDQMNSKPVLNSGGTTTEPRFVISGALQSVGTNGKYGSKFNGTTHFLKAATGALGQALTRSTVLRFDSIASGIDITSDGSQNALFFNASGSLATYAGATVAFKTGIAAGDFATVIEMQNGASSFSNYNGTDASYNPSTLSLLRESMGSAWDGTTASAFAAITFCERIMFASGLNSTNRGVLQANQKAYWGTP
jgi:hypothetical protein